MSNPTPPNLPFSALRIIFNIFLISEALLPSLCICKRFEKLLAWILRDKYTSNIFKNCWVNTG